MQQRNTNKPRRMVLVLREHDSVWASEAKAQVLATAEAIHRGLEQAGHEVISLQVESPPMLLSALKPFNPGRYVVFNWYEGIESGAEDGAQVAALLETLGYVYTGADALAFRVAQDKRRAKRVLAAHGIPTPEWQPICGDNLGGWKRYPAIVKVANEHGSECLTEQSVVNDEAHLRARVTELQYAGFTSLMVSEFVDGREFTVSVWGNGNLQCLPVLEVDFSACLASVPRLRTCAAKWDTASQAYQSVKLVCPQNLSPDLYSRIERVARNAYRAFGLRDYGRIDLRLREGVPYVIDVNCNPDISADSSFVAAAERAGYDYSAMLDCILQSAIHRAPTD